MPTVRPVQTQALLTVEDYLGKFALSPAYAGEVTADGKAKAAVLCGRVNTLIKHAMANGVQMDVNPERGNYLSSGWRPKAYNATVKGAAVNSLHCTFEALDLYDPDGEFDDWLFTFGAPLMIDIGLWAEHPAATRRWSHLQIKAPRSGNRFYYP